MPYTRIWISENDAEYLLALSKKKARYMAKQLGTKPERVTMRSAAESCFIEGLGALEGSVWEYEDDDE